MGARKETKSYRGTRKETKSTTYTKWEFDEPEFRSLLGITDTETVLTVDVNFYTRKVTVTLSPLTGGEIKWST